MLTRTVFGIVATHEQADKLLAQLESNGFARKEVSILLPDEARREASRLDVASRAFQHAQTETHAPDGAAIGATAGTAIGGALGLLAGLGALAIPGIGFLLAAGPIVGIIGGLGVGAALGSLAGVLVGLGIPEHHARKYENLVQDGNILVAAHCDSASDQNRATLLFTQCGATELMSSVISVPQQTRRDDRISASSYR